jgi:hypothetical protein
MIFHVSTTTPFSKGDEEETRSTNGRARPVKSAWLHNTPHWYPPPMGTHPRCGLAHGAPARGAASSRPSNCRRYRVCAPGLTSPRLARFGRRPAPPPRDARRPCCSPPVCAGCSCGLSHFQVEPSLTWAALCESPPSSRLLPEKVVAAALPPRSQKSMALGKARVGGAFSAQWR